MRYLKRFFLSMLLLFFSLYFVILVVSNIFLYFNKSNIEKIVSDALVVSNSNIKGIFNFPFFFLRIGELKLTDSKGVELKIKNAKIFYNIFKFDIKYPAETLYLIDVDRVVFESEYKKASGYLKKIFEKYPFFYISQEQRNTIKIKEIYIKLTFFPNLKTYFYFNNFKNYISHNIMSFSGEFSGEISQIGKVNFLESINVSSVVNISNFIIGGVPVIENENFRFVSTNLENIKDDILKNIFFVKNSDGMFTIEFKRNFSINYPEKDRYYLIEYLMPKGEYFANLNCLFKNEKFDLNLFVSNVNSLDKFMLGFFGNDVRKKLVLKLNTYLFKQLSADIDFYKDVNGVVNFDLFYLKQRLRGGLNFIYKDDVLRLFSKDIRLNDINFYGLDTYFYFNGRGGIDISGVDLNRGIILKGAFSNNEGDFSLKIKNVFMSESGGFLNGENYFKISFKPFRLISFNINLKASDSLKKEIFFSDLNFKENKLSINKLSFFNVLSLDLMADLTNTNIIVNGNLSINKNKMPLSGTIFFGEKYEINKASFNLDKRILLNVIEHEGKYRFRLNTENYNFKKFGIDGILNLNYGVLKREK